MNSELQSYISALEEWIPFCESLFGLDDETWNRSLAPGKWPIKSIVSHIMLWDRYYYEEAIHKIALSEPLTLVNKAYQEFNRNADAYAKTVGADDLLRDAIAVRKRIIEDLRSLPEERLVQSYIDGEGRAFLIEEYLKDFVGHDRHHMDQIRQVLQERQHANP
jgi:Mycothiol maleylpyruvate isomerase N-terminal domain.